MCDASAFFVEICRILSGSDILGEIVGNGGIGVDWWGWLVV